jgi:SAM-dependent methyltransferase
MAMAGRRRSFGQNYQPTVVDRLGVWLSWRQIRRFAGPWEGKHIGDFGCGFHATIARRALDRAAGAVLVDVALSEELKRDPRVVAIEGVLPGAIASVSSDSLDLVLCTSVIEHLWAPSEALSEFYRVTRHGGICLFNVPSWKGKRFLELSAFKFGLSPLEEMDDHKMYYDVRDFWPLLVRAGFIPHNIRCFPHKFGLCTFAACRVEKG